MKTILALALVSFAISFCNLPGLNRNENNNNSNNSNNSTPEPSPKDKFVGTWVHPADAEVDLLTMTIRRDDTFTIRRDRRSGTEKTVSGKYAIRDGKLYPDGEFGREAKNGFSVDGNRLKIVGDDGKKAIYFDKQEAGQKAIRIEDK